jgi:DNA polymerase-1
MEKRNNTNMSAKSNRYKILAIDGDIIAYRLAAANETPINWHGDLWTLHSQANEVIEAMAAQIKSLRDHLEADKVVVALTDSVNFRKELNPLYKNHRKGQRKPVAYTAAIDHLKTAYNALVMPRLEADDVLGIVATSLPWGEVVIASVDKDFKSVPCHFYNTGSSELAEVSEAQANYNFLTQALTGDTADGYPGLPGCGPVMAVKVLPPLSPQFDTQSAWACVLEAYKKKGLSEFDALLQARMAYILRKGDYNPTTNKIKLWGHTEPSQPASN